MIMIRMKLEMVHLEMQCSGFFAQRINYFNGQIVLSEFTQFDANISAIDLELSD
jgi:hypothetical protein